MFKIIKFLQDTAIASRKFRSKGDTTKQWSLSTFQNLMRFEKILCLFDSKTWDSCQERVKFTSFILRWDFMSDYRVSVDLLLWRSLGCIGCCNFMAFQSGLNQQFTKCCHIIECASVYEVNSSSQRQWFTKNETWCWQYWQVHAYIKLYVREKS